MKRILSTTLDQDEPLAGMQYVERFGVTAGELTSFALHALSKAATPPWDLQEIQLQLYEVGWRSSVLVLVVGAATGVTIAQFTSTTLSNFGSVDSVIPALLSRMMFRQLGPLLAGLVISGRVGAAMTAELAVLRMTEQIDALESLAVDSYRHLVVTRIVACAIALPILTSLMCFAEIAGGYGFEAANSDNTFALYMSRVFANVTWSDYVLPTLASCVTGIVIAVVSCYFGYTADESAGGVRRASMQSVVVCCLFVIALSLIISEVLFVWVPGNVR